MPPHPLDAHGDPCPRTEPSLWPRGLIAASVAAAVNVILFGAARAAGVPLELTETFDDTFRPMSVLSFVLATLLDGGVVATATAALCRRWLRRPRTSFTALAIVGTIGSLALPIISDGTTATKVVLCVAHVVAAAIIVPALSFGLPQRRHRTTVEHRLDPEGRTVGSA